MRHGEHCKVKLPCMVGGGPQALRSEAALRGADDGELDWKVIAISAEDPKASSVNDVEDVERCVSAPPHHHLKLMRAAVGFVASANIWVLSHPPSNAPAQIVCCLQTCNLNKSHVPCSLH